MRITLVVLLCSVTAALASPTNMLLDTQMSELTDRALAAEDYDDMLESLKMHIMGEYTSAHRQGQAKAHGQ